MLDAVVQPWYALYNALMQRVPRLNFKRGCSPPVLGGMDFAEVAAEEPPVTGDWRRGSGCGLSV